MPIRYIFRLADTYMFGITLEGVDREEVIDMLIAEPLPDGVEQPLPEDELIGYFDMISWGRSDLIDFDDFAKLDIQGAVDGAINNAHVRAELVCESIARARAVGIDATHRGNMNYLKAQRAAEAASCQS